MFDCEYTTPVGVLSPERVGYCEGAGHWSWESGFEVRLCYYWVCCWTQLWLVKASFLAFFYTLFYGLPQYRKAWWVVVIFTVLAYLGCWIAGWVEVKMSPLWSRFRSRPCRDKSAKVTTGDSCAAWFFRTGESNPAQPRSFQLAVRRCSMRGGYVTDTRYTSSEGLLG